MASNGYFAEGMYQPKSTETWADLTNAWSTYTSWQYTPNLTVNFTTDVIDFGRVETINPTTELDIIGQATTQIDYGNTIDSAGNIVSSSTVTYAPGDTPVAIKARYFVFTFFVGYDDSAGGEVTPAILNIRTNLNSQTITINQDSIDSSTLTGSVGERQLDVPDALSSIKTAVITAHGTTGTYVADNYVEGDSAGATYIAEGDASVPYVTLNKTTSPMSIRIYDLNTFGPTKTDCTFDAILTGLPSMTVDAVGNIQG